MSLLAPLDRATITDSQIAASLDGVQRQLGVLPNMFRVFAHSPVALNAYLQLSGVVAKGRLSAQQREQIALAVAQANDCGYCNAAHAAIGGMVGLVPAQIAAARRGEADDPRTAAALRLAQRIVATRGHVPLAELDVFKAEGLDEATILEVLVNVVLNIYTNYTNHLARTPIDFPQDDRAVA